MSLLKREDPGVFGRDPVLECLLKRAEGLLAGFRQNVALIGAGGTGKTSILERFAEAVQGENIVVLRISTAAESFRTFAERTVARLLFQALLKKGVRAGEDIDSLLTQAGTHLPRTAQASRSVLHLARKEPTSAFAALLELSGHLSRETGWSSIVMLDEFDRIEGYRLRDPFGVFGKKLMLEKETMYIITSSRTHYALLTLQEKFNLLFGQFEVIRLKGLDPESSRELLSAQLDGAHIPDSISKFIVSLTGGHPLYLRRLGACLRERLQGPGEGRTTSLEDVIRALEKELFDPDGSVHLRFKRTVERFPQPRLAAVYMPILVSTAEGKHTCARIAQDLGRNRRDVSKQLSRLIRMDLLMKAGQFHYLPDPFFRFWLDKVYSQRLRQADPGREAAKRCFHSAVAGAFTVYCEAGRKGMTERVRELFTLFNNETIELNRRQHKLPHFHKIQPPAPSTNGPLPIYARNGAGYWAGQIANGHMTEAEVSRFARTCKSSRLPVKRRVIISQKPLNLNASLVAKEEKIWTWDLDDLNLLLGLYGKPPIIL